MIDNFSMIYVAHMSLPLLMIWLGLSFFLTFMLKEWLWHFLSICVSLIVLFSCVTSGDGNFATGDIFIILIVILVQFFFGIINNTNE